MSSTSGMLPPDQVGYEWRPSVLGLTVTLLVLTTLAVFFRLLAKANTKAWFAVDDWLIIASLLCFYGYVGVQIWNVNFPGYGYNPAILPPEYLLPSLYAFYILPILSIPTISFAKLSVLAFYYRIFATRNFRLAVIILGSTCLAWFLACQLATVLRCVPPRAAYDPTVNGSCINFDLFFIIIEPINCLQDILIVLLPLGPIRKLQISFRQKVALSFIFLLGGFVAITSLIRIGFTYDPSQSQYALINSGKWLVVQLAFAIVCACLPTYKPLLALSRAMPSHVRSWYSRLITKGTSFTRTDPERSTYDRSGWASTGRLNPPHHHLPNNSVLLTEVKRAKESDEESLELGRPPLPPNVITVQRRMDQYTV